MGLVLKNNCIPILLLAVCVFALFLTAPTNGDFSWNDAPRHALNGAFLKDLISELPSDPEDFAIEYYFHFPSLTILFYPPLMPLIGATFFALFGVTHITAQAGVSVMYFVLAISVFFLALRWLPKWEAFSASLIFIASPEIALWGRQVMLDIPALAWLALAGLTFLKYLDGGRKVYFPLWGIFLVCALYTKQTMVFSLLIFLPVLIYERGFTGLFQREIFPTFIFLGVSMLPLLYLTFEFGQINLSSVLGDKEPTLERSSLDAWFYYAEALPKQTGWVTFLLGISFFCSLPFSKNWQISSRDMFLLLGWFIGGYIFFSGISLREPRHDLAILLPFSIFAVYFVFHNIRKWNKQLSTVVILLWAVCAFGFTLIFSEVPFVKGYAEAARFITNTVPDKSLVLFSGYRDGSFSFNLRCLKKEKEIFVLRADKLLLRVAIKRERGVLDSGLSQAEIYDLLKKYKVRYVVSESNFWDDLPSMASLQKVLEDPSLFKALHRIQIESNYNTSDRQLVVYENLANFPKTSSLIEIDMLSIGRKFSRVLSVK